MARFFAEEGAAVVITARRTPQLEALRQTLPRPDAVLVLPVDLLDPSAVGPAAAEALAWRGRIDVLVNNAGMSQRSSVEDTPMEAVRRIMELNFMAPVALTQAVLPAMRAAGTGQIVAISSVAGYVSTPLRSTYAASKRALNGFCESLRAELSDTPIDVTVICPGYVATEITAKAVAGDGIYGILDENNASGLTPDACARGCVDAVYGRKREVYIGGREIYSIYLQRWVPGLLARMVPRFVPK